MRSGLQRRLQRFGLAIIGICAVLSSSFWLFVRLDVVPILTEHVRTKSRGSVEALDHDLAVPIAAGDLSDVRRRLRLLAKDPDFGYAIVRDPSGETLARAGERPPRDVHAPAGRTIAAQGGFTATSPIDLEGVSLGSVTTHFETRRVDQVLHWLALFALAGGLLTVAACVFALRYARAFVAPIHDVISLSRGLARGELDRRLAGKPPGELGQLVDALNGMAEALEKARTSVVDASRLAGMAEVATGVLHNVGNVLNSVNVSAQLMEDALRGSKVAMLPRVVGLIEEHRADLGRFLTEDPKGQKVPPFLQALSGQLEDERRTLLGETASLRQHVEHIKSVVTAQQSFARARGVSEVVAIDDVIETALAIEKSSFEDRSIKVVRDFETLPPVRVDRNRLIQILINLLSNARHAITDAVDARERIVTLQTRHVGDRVEIQVGDTGVGISEANLARIFQHGFTTKKNGHGFGLHSSALAATELGGSVRAESDGPGRGARFTIDLPLTLAEAA